MKQALLTILFLVTAVYARADQFTYDPHGKRDPFSSLVTSTGAAVAYDSDLTLADMSLEGVMADPSGNSAAIINGKIVKVADQVGPYKVEAISSDQVELTKEGERFTIKLKRGGL